MSIRLNMESTSASGSHADGAVETWHVDRTLRGIVRFGAVVAALGAPASIAAGLVGVPNAGMALWSVVAVVSAAAAVFFHVLVTRPLVEAGPGGIWIRNIMNEHSVAWADVRKITPGYGGLTIELLDGRSVCATAIQKSNCARAFGKTTRSDHIAQALTEHAARGG